MTMAKQYRLKNGVKLQELEKYGYAGTNNMFFKLYEKLVKTTPKTKIFININDFYEHCAERCGPNVSIYKRMRNEDGTYRYMRQKWSFGEKEIPYIQDLLDAGLLEEAK